jgi:alkanesulfonate monooxygenase SsuD/methylene tetrahydromethanopterin reductase-like flavin-dependent oxidoreductase (luciferase family)
VRFGLGLWCLQSTWSSPRGHARAYGDYLEDVRLADALGYDSLWLSEHHFYYDGYCPALLPVAAAALAVTKRLRLGTGMLLAPYQRPERVATAAREIGRRFDGRLDLGVALGYRDVEFDGKGVPRAERVRRLTTLVDALEGDAAAGTFAIWMGAQAAPGVARAGRLGHGILLSGALPLPLVGALVAAHRNAWIEGGQRGKMPPRVAALRNVWITSDPDERAAVLDWQRASYVLYQGLGWSVAESAAGAAIDFAADAERAIETAVATTIIGSVEEVIDGLRGVADAGVDDVVLRIAIEGAPQEAIHEVMRTFADGVFPVLAGGSDDRTVPCVSA